MPECHKCPHDVPRQVALRLLTEYEASPCASCTLPDDPTHHGRTHVDLDAAPEALDGLHHDPCVDLNPAAQHAAVMAIDLFRAIMRLDDRTRAIVMFRIEHRERPLRVIADRLGISPQSAYRMLDNARAQWPALADVVPQAWVRNENAA